MTQLTATPDKTNGAIALHIVPSGTVRSIIRADANGTRPVRLAPGTLPFNTETAVVDYEPSLSGSVQYRVDDGGDGASAWATLDGVELPRFILPHLPAFQVIVQTVTAHSAGRDSRSTIHEVIGRDDPLVILGRLRSRRGTLEILAQNYRHAQDLEAIFQRGQVVMYRQPENPGLDMYLVGVRIASVPVADVWLTTVEYVEVSFPPGDIATGAKWTFDELAKTGGSFDNVAADYRTYWDLAVNERAL